MLLSYLLYLFTGALAGTMAGMYGVGGGLVVVPGLALAFMHAAFHESNLMQIAEGTSLAAMIFTSIAASFSHRARGALLWPLVYKLLPGLVVGTIGGALIAGMLNGLVLRILFSIFLLYSAYKFLFKPEADSPDEVTQFPNLLMLSLIGMVTGLMAGIFGIGGGAVLIPILIHYKFSLAKASGTSAMCAVVISIIGTISYMIVGWNQPHLPADSWGYVYWPAALIVAAASLCFVQVGSKLTKILSTKALKRLFAVVLIGTVIELVPW